MRVAFTDHYVIESHPESDRHDLYIHSDQLSRIPELREFLESFDLLNDDTRYHEHIPFPAILVQCARSWMEQHNGKLPTGFDQKQIFKQLINSKRKTIESLNFNEAIKFSYKSTTIPQIDSKVSSILQNSNIKSLNVKSDPFWILVAALKLFLKNEGNGFFPVSVALPDMTSESESYVRLKQIYQNQSIKDINTINYHVKSILKSIGLPDYTISEDEVSYFVSHCRDIAHISTRSLSQEYDVDTFSPEDIRDELTEIDENDIASSPSKILNPKNIH